MIKSFDVPVKWHEFSYVNKCHKKSNYSRVFMVEARTGKPFCVQNGGSLGFGRGYSQVKSTGVIINSDVNGACQIVRKCKPDAFSVKADGVEVWDGLLRPVKLFYGSRLRCAPSVLRSSGFSFDCVER